MAFKTQANRQIAVTTPLGEDVLLINSMSGQEQLGRPFEYTLDLFSEQPTKVKFEDLLGEKMTVKLELSPGKFRYFNGHVNRFVQTEVDGNTIYYQATLVPWLWFLTRTADCRIFQNKKVPDIIKTVFQDFGFSDLEDDLNGDYRQWVYCVQYRETAFNFVSRLMEQEGIYYYFEHKEDAHTLILADSPSAHAPYPGYEDIQFLPPSAGRTKGQVVSDWTIEQSYQPGRCVLKDFDFEKPNAPLEAKQDTFAEADVHNVDRYEIFDYPGEYSELADGKNYTKLRMDAIDAQFQIISGVTDARGVCNGFTFALTDYPLEDQNKEYLLTSVSCQLSAGDYGSSGDEGGSGPVFSSSFTAIDSKQEFRLSLETPKPAIQGPQTAIVVGPSGDEIHTDEYGRVRVQFHWDRYGKSDQDSSCWIRVSQYWAGKKWGAMYIPRIGQEVIVEFIEGDPDRPIITGRVYNAQNMPPYSLPAEKTKSTLKSDSTKGGGGFNEIRFEDKKGSEEVYIQAEKDQNNLVKNNETTSVGNDRTENVGNNETITIGNDRTETVGNNETITIGNDRTETVGNNETLTIVSNQTQSVGANQTETVGSNQSMTIGANKTETIAVAKALTIGAAYQVSVGAAMNETIGAAKAEEIGAAKIVAVGAASSENVGANKSVNAGGNISESAGKDVSIKSGKKMSLDSGDDFSVKGGKKGVIDIKDELTIKCGKAVINMKKNGDITINGKKITIKGSGDVIIKGKKILQN